MVDWIARIPTRLETLARSSGPSVYTSVDGSFWNECSTCYRGPETNSDLWQKKIATNRARDKKKTEQLEDAGWQVIRIWEHEIKEDTFACVKKIQETLQHGGME